MRFFPTKKAVGWALVPTLLSTFCNAIELDVNDKDSIKAAAKIAAEGLVEYYHGDEPGQIQGNLPQPYYWWECGAMFGALIDYWYYTGDDQFNQIVINGMLHQVGTGNAFMPPNQTQSLGNDDQAFWGIAAMMAAERGFPNPPGTSPQWLALAQAVFNSQAARWDSATCNGGLRWQIFSFNNGYDYKNTISNGCFFHLAARLARYTGNETYAEWAMKSYDWTKRVGLITDDYKFYDGASVDTNCTHMDRIQWTYNGGIYLAGAAFMYNITNGTGYWADELGAILDAQKVYFRDEKIMYEVACEPYGKCNIDQRSFKAYLARWMGVTTQVAAFTRTKIMDWLSQSAVGAAQSCIGGTDKQTCGARWTPDVEAKWDGNFGVGEQMSALEIFQNLLAPSYRPPCTASTCGNSTGDPSAGTGNSVQTGKTNRPATTGDKVGAGFLTTLCLGLLLGGTYWLIV
ncbi:hydrolase 76 protein [Orbilia oligospora]|uniref:Mannan endo-1,6-alpha-mannosidase n=1 Tax=Orbilia oligospora TaxID=2813651 RepID=A0A6G1M4M1_ORBOL|nr:hydrolase 76 protein [Orbilia oligospora]KAF3201669.1 hydrolase 76 protein [Orbilia oligospora]KAF3212806.1 hydrolase 76 protein [Orbilia oligospora]KAF3227256.1 hydrolase 76 protein [Orbilia oligospora]KAF3245492.1 hydrolase 76 protein [Orbilia oligospora]